MLKLNTKKIGVALYVLAATLCAARMSSSAFADSFTDIIQDLAVQTACIGMYSKTEAGGGWYDDPYDYYTPQMMAERFAQMSGNMTRTTTFYGVCFDYAQFAYNDIERYESLYKQNGMYENKYWIAGVHDNPNGIQLQYPGTANEHTTIQNGVYVIYPNNGQRNVKTHRLLNKGDRATGHAWLWVERADGVQFWIDPTWTDNLGYVVYGYVKDGEEIQCRPDRDFCINYPDALNALPLPPPMGARKAPSPSANSTDRNEIINDSGTGWFVTDLIIEGFDKAMRKTFIDATYDFKKDYIAFLASVNVPFSSFTDKSLSVNKMAFSLDMAVLLDSFSGVLGLEYLRNVGNDYNIHGGLLNIDFNRRLTSFLSWYLGVGLGLRFDALNKESHYEPDDDIAWLAGTGWFAFRAHTGLLFNISRIFTKIDVSYDNVIGFSVGTGIGFGLKAVRM